MKSGSPRKDILHNIDPLFKPAGTPLPNVTFDTTQRAALRSGDWKIITGNPGQINELPRGKTNNVVSEHVRHKPSYTST